ncbi:hypothetical protein CWI91_05870, partial [Bifidobacterium animalis subsp. lactis]
MKVGWVGHRHWIASALPNDIYVSMGQIKKYGLRKGDAVRG